MIAKTVLAAGFMVMSVGIAQAGKTPTIREAMEGTYKVQVNGNLVATVTILPGGRVSGVQPNGDKDTGRWRISPNDRYCVTFTKWLDHSEHCSNISIDANGTVHGDGFSAHR